MPKTFIDADIVRKIIRGSGSPSLGLASIREIRKKVYEIEKASGVEFFHMEIGSPDLAPPKIAIEAEAEAVFKGIGAHYPPSEGIEPLKGEISAFVRNYLDIQVSPEGCIPTVGSMQGCFMAMMVAARRQKNKSKILFIDPGFPSNKRQAQTIGLVSESFDVYAFRGNKLGPKLESYLASGDVAALLYSSPNNPSWICFTEQELNTIGALCEKYDVIALEDSAYLGMDFRSDYSQPGVPPFISTVAKHTDRYILLLSSSKAFSLAGQRIGMTVISDYLFESTGDNLFTHFGSDQFGQAYIFGAMHPICSGVCHTAQVGLTALLRAINTGEYNFIAPLREYERRAVVTKKLFLENGFHLVYDKDGDQPLADGFYFTVSYPGFSGSELVEEFMYYGIGTISLTVTGSERHEGVRICVSSVGGDRYEALAHRLNCFNTAHNNRFRAIEQ